MKFKNCFIDGPGNIWRINTLIEQSKDLTVFLFKVDSVNVDEVIRWKLVNLRDYYIHFARVKDADLTIPIILRNDGYIMVGWHRVIKAMAEGVRYLGARQFVVNPAPDFKME